ncbi:hypothetical protein AGABI2DRAFT_120781 [Agaricus bisporus var. bisporus H97]|uniref:hypothetical protein n=1 Tax=Agaricus bisporus var. bisporus (strain H97 / ATCC MYA-4626 / FGSC 10389) TaxID=936046 RepID=UPI00029F7479|nr:hypothetical protein AGABI2DRAFT_120781 [Agaricus bisporus var. bisporus H97]EKV44654.1 hypothetical protein AGABI2DRAFT_120781 [Agaricus bisporus var. bisporus H97]
MVTTKLTTDEHYDNVPATRISRQLTYLIYASLAISTCVFASSMVLLGFSSYWLSIAGFGLILIHHFIILGNRWKQRRLRGSANSNPSTTPSPMPTSSRRFVIFSTWFITLVYVAAFAIVVMNAQYMFRGWFEYWDSLFISAIVEAVFLFFEIPLLVMIALWCMKERRAISGAEDAKWYYLPQYQK